MDIDSITNAYRSILKVKDSIAALLNQKTDPDAKVRVNKALEEIGSIQDTLLELVLLQTKNKKSRGDSYKKKRSRIN
jgi:hypothetical protein